MKTSPTFFKHKANRRPLVALGLLMLWGCILCVGTASAADWTQMLLGKKTLGSNSPCFPGCPKCDDYCPKPLVCTPRVCTNCPEPYCAKPLPCVTGPKSCLPGCYSPKPLPPFCDPKCPPHWSPVGGR